MSKIIGTVMTDESIKKATGKTWPQWFKILDKLPKNSTHTDRARWLYTRHLKHGWWCQKVVVVYELTRGLRQPHEVVGGFQVSASKTYPISAVQLYRWFTVPDHQKKWLGAQKLTITTATPGKSVRIKWPDETRVDVDLYPKGPKKCSAVVQHQKLPNAKLANQRQTWWRKKLQKLSDVIA